ncbi:MAG TPA: segregation/condensation protein A [Actinomycetota bacterium]|nr:segregation/condensation protein A [Actinomycetota bacterium]
MAYQVKLQVFEGPFDLLLHLIAKRELDIYEVSLASITEEYLDYIRSMQDLDLEVATEFLIVAATLIEIKAARLLPGPPVDDEAALALSERDMLIARLLEYRAFKDAASQLAAMIAENAGFIGRRAGPGREFDHLCPDLLARVSPADLATIAARALAPKPVASLDLSHITPIRVSVAEAIATVLAMLAERTSLTFREITKDCTTRIDKVVRFLAVLELIKRGQADVDQTENFGEITVKRGIGDVRIDAGAVDEYEGAPIAEPEADA